MFKPVYAAALTLLAATAPGFANEPSTTAADPIEMALPADKNELVQLIWEDLLPPGERDEIIRLYMARFANGPIAEGGADDIAVQIGTFNTVDALDGRRVRIPGFAVPFEYGGKGRVKEFLLVPSFGDCLHFPPPPPNQTVHVRSSKNIKLKDLAQAIWIEGRLSATSSYTDLANSAYALDLESVEVFEYE